MKDLTIAIPVRNDRLIFRCVSSIDVSCYVNIIANNAEKDFVDLLQKEFCHNENITVIVSDRIGLGANYNLAIETCKTEYILLMDSDCYFEAGSISKIRSGLNHSPLSKGIVEFESNNFISKIISRHRYFNTSSFVNAYSPPLAFSITILRHFLSHFFNDGLEWSEDFDFDRRIQITKLKIERIPEAVIKHKALTLKEDLKSAKNYGFGYAQGVILGVYPKVDKTPYKKIQKYISYYTRVKAVSGTLSAIYGLIWLKKYREGFFVNYQKLYDEKKKSCSNSTAC